MRAGDSHQHFQMHLERKVWYFLPKHINFISSYKIIFFSTCLERPHNSVVTLYRFDCTCYLPHHYQKHINGIIFLYQFFKKSCLFYLSQRTTYLEWPLNSVTILCRLHCIRNSLHCYRKHISLHHFFKKWCLFYRSKKTTCLESLDTGFIVLETHHIAAIFFRFLLSGVLLGQTFLLLMKGFRLDNHLFKFKGGVTIQVVLLEKQTKKSLITMSANTACSH